MIPSVFVIYEKGIRVCVAWGVVGGGCTSSAHMGEYLGRRRQSHSLTLASLSKGREELFPKPRTSEAWVFPQSSDDRDVFMTRVRPWGKDREIKCLKAFQPSTLLTVSFLMDIAADMVHLGNNIYLALRVGTAHASGIGFNFGCSSNVFRSNAVVSHHKSCRYIWNTNHGGSKST